MPIKIKPDVPYSKMIDQTFVSPEDEEEVGNPAMQDKINNLLDFFGKIENPYGQFDPDFLEGTHSKDIVGKKAYPNTDYYMYIPGQHDTQKWLQAVKNVYHSEKDGNGRVISIRRATQGWHPLETYDFLNWLKYYEEGTHLKYKFAQNWYENGAPGYFLHVKPDPKKEEPSPIGGNDIDMARDAISSGMSASEKKHVIEKQRNKIIGRLDSAEKLLRTQDGQLFAGKEFESLLETIYQLKKKVQMINKISVSTTLYDDMIIREANILNRKGFVKAASLLFSLAQANNPPPANTGTDNKDAPAVPPAAPPTQGQGAPGGLPSMGPGMPQNPPESAPNENTPSKGMSDFLNNLETGNVGEKEDTLEVEDTLDVQDADLLVTEAQELPAEPLPPTPKVGPAPPPPAAPVKKAPKVDDDKPLEVEEGQEFDKTPQTRDFDNMLDAAFSNIKVSDVVAKLEDLAKIFKTREIPRQLSMVDMMLDSLGLAAYFPSLSEATNKALESNNYISTRIDDILAKLQGGIESREMDLKGDQASKSNAPGVDNLRESLKMREEKEKNRKKLRKEQADQELEMSNEPEAEGLEKETPQVDIEEDLSKPIPAKKPAPAAPVAKPPITPLV